MIEILLLLGGYLVGSLSPGYLFGLWIKGVDIRRFGNKNTGATNTYHVVGPIWGILTAIFDVSKGALAYLVAALLLKSDWSLLVGLAAVAGHIWPFYLGFRGGKGVAALFGLCASTFIFGRGVSSLLLTILSVLYALAISKQFIFESPLRSGLKLAGMVFPLGLIWLPQSLLLILAASLFLVSLGFDLMRMRYRKLNRRYLRIKIFAKSKELKKFSGTSFFLAGVSLVLFLFPQWIAILSLTGFILGDILAPAGQFFLPFRILGKKTVGGALVIFLCSLVASTYLFELSGIPLVAGAVFVAAVLSAILDQFSFILDDNLLVPLGTAVGLYMFQLTLYQTNWQI